MAISIKSDHKIMELLEVTELRHFVAQTNKGELTLMLRKGETAYRLVLDAVPVSQETHNILMPILFPEKKVEIPTVNKMFHAELPIVPALVSKPKGRPKGSKNR